MSPQRLRDAPDPVRPRRSTWLPHTFRWAWQSVRAAGTRLHPPETRAAECAQQAAVSGSANPIPEGPGGPEERCWVPTVPGARPARRPVQFILVVTADLCRGRALAQHLEAQNYLVLTARSVREASEKLIIEPALLILEADLPDASGWDLLDWLARCGRTVPVVLIAGRERRGHSRVRLHPILVLPPAVALDILVAIVQEHLLAPATAYGA